MVKKLDLLLVNPGARKQVYGKLGSSLSGIKPPFWCVLDKVTVKEKLKNLLWR